MITKPFVGVLFVLCAGFATAPVAAAAGKDNTCVSVADGWVRLMPVQVPMTAGYARIINGCDHAVAVRSVRSTVFVDVSLHETVVTDGISRMVHVHRLPIEAGESAVLKPTGMHLMMMGPEPLKAGQKLPFVFELDDGSELATTLDVRAQ